MRLMSISSDFLSTLSYRVFTGQGKLKNVMEFVLSGKVRENDLRSCRLQITVIFAAPNIKKQANLRLPLNVQKLEMFQLQGGKALLTPQLGPLSFAYCSY